MAKQSKSAQRPTPKPKPTVELLPGADAQLRDYLTRGLSRADRRFFTESDEGVGMWMAKFLRFLRYGILPRSTDDARVLVGWLQSAVQGGVDVRALVKTTEQYVQAYDTAYLAGPTEEWLDRMAPLFEPGGE